MLDPSLIDFDIRQSVNVDPGPRCRQQTTLSQWLLPDPRSVEKRGVPNDGSAFAMGREPRKFQTPNDIVFRRRGQRAAPFRRAQRRF